MRELDFDDEDTCPGIRSGGARVIVADDDGAMREMVAMRLSGEGYEVHEVDSGNELLAALATTTVDAWPLDRVDLIVLDFKMPGLTGLDVLRKLRSAKWDTPAILMTAFPDDQMVRHAGALHVTLLAKPFSLEVLANAAMVCLTGRSPESPGSQRRVPT